MTLNRRNGILLLYTHRERERETLVVKWDRTEREMMGGTPCCNSLLLLCFASLYNEAQQLTVRYYHHTCTMHFIWNIFPFFLNSFGLFFFFFKKRLYLILSFSSCVSLHFLHFPFFFFFAFQEKIWEGVAKRVFFSIVLYFRDGSLFRRACFVTPSSANVVQTQDDDVIYMYCNVITSAISSPNDRTSSENIWNGWSATTHPSRRSPP